MKFLIIKEIKGKFRRIGLSCIVLGALDKSHCQTLSPIGSVGHLTFLQSRTPSKQDAMIQGAFFGFSITTVRPTERQDASLASDAVDSFLWHRIKHRNVYEKAALQVSS